MQNKECNNFYVDKTIKRGYSYKCKNCKKNRNNSTWKNNYQWGCRAKRHKRNIYWFALCN